MPNIKIICIGSLKERWLSQAQAEYAKRLSAFCRLTIIEKKECALPKNASAAQTQKALLEEGDALLSACSGSVIALSPEGETLSSEAFSALVRKLSDAGDVSFVTGGSNGLSEPLKQKAQRVVSFSALTMPHQLFRIVLLEQIYRAFMIASGRTYHK